MPCAVEHRRRAAYSGPRFFRTRGVSPPTETLAKWAGENIYSGRHPFKSVGLESVVTRDVVRIGGAFALLTAFAAWCLYLVWNVRAERSRVESRVRALVELQSARDVFGRALGDAARLAAARERTTPLLASLRAESSASEATLAACARVEAALRGLSSRDAMSVRAASDALLDLIAAVRRETGALSTSLGERWTHAYLLALLATLFAAWAVVSLVRARRLGKRSEAARAALSLVERDLRGVLERSPVGMLILRGGHVVYANPAALGYGGAWGGALEGRALHELVHEGDRLRLAGQLGPVQVRWLRGSAEPLSVELFPAQPVHFGGGEAQLIVVSDITERVREQARAEHLAQERAARAMAEEAVTAREAFISVASHELRTPLTSLSAAAQLLVRAHEGVEGPAGVRARAAAEVVERQTKRLSELVTALLDVAAIQKGRMELKPELCDLASVVRELVPLLARDANHGGSTVTVDVPDTLVGEWDPTRLGQVVTNLVVNALKFGHGRSVHVSLTEQDANAVLEVRDDGVGFPPEVAPRLFDVFTRAAGDAYDGMGLGLFVVRSIAEAHGGQVSAEAQPGGGARFRVTLPLRTGLIADPQIQSSRPFYR